MAQKLLIGLLIANLLLMMITIPLYLRNQSTHSEPQTFTSQEPTATIDQANSLNPDASENKPNPDKQNYDNTISDKNLKIQDLQQQLHDLQKLVTQQQGNLKQLEIILNDKQQESDTLTQTIKSLKSSSSDSPDQEDIVIKISKLNAQINSKQTEISQLKSDISQLQQNVSGFEQHSMQQADTIAALKHDLDILQQRLDAMQAQATVKAKDQSPSKPVHKVVPREPTKPNTITSILTNPADTPTFDLEFLAVDNNAAVVQNTVEQPLVVGWHLFVFRQQKLIAVMKIFNIEDSLAACQIVSKDSNTPLAMTDKVRTFNKTP